MAGNGARMELRIACRMVGSAVCHERETFKPSALKTIVMTVLAYAYTPEGFVVGADARLIIDGRPRKVVTDRQRKLIQLRAPGVDLICGWAGAAVIQLRNGPRFDLTDQTERAGGVLSGTHLGEKYVMQLSEVLRTSCPDQLACLTSGKDRTSALFVGYLDNHARHWAWILGSEPQEDETRPQVCTYRVHSGCCEEACGKDRLPIPTSLKEGEYGIRRYIECCIEHSDEYGGEPQTLIIHRP
jgi:archaeosine-15-forming tRNA-guanine transglycosylase